MIPFYAMTMDALLKPSTLSAFVEVGGRDVVGTTDGRAWVSTDAGKSYVATGVGPSRAPVRALVASGEQAWACTADGVFAMNDKLVWNPILGGVDCKALSVHEKSAIVVTPNAIHTTTDAGARWHAVTKTTSELDDVTSVNLVAGSTKTILLARAGHTLDRSQDGGKSFQRVYSPPPEQDERGRPGVDYCGRERTTVEPDGSLVRAASNGSTVNISSGLKGRISGIAGDEQHLVVVTDQPGLFYSKDGGLVWNAAAPPTPWPTGVAVSGGSILVGGIDGIFAARNALGPWNRISEQSVAGMVQRADASVVIAGAGGTGLSRDGATVTWLDTEPTRLVLALAPSETLVAAETGGYLVGPSGTLRKITRGAPPSGFANCETGVAFLDMSTLVKNVEVPKAWCTTNGKDAWSVLTQSDRFRAADRRSARSARANRTATDPTAGRRRVATPRLAARRSARLGVDLRRRVPGAHPVAG